MKSSGFVRRIDALNRIVIPKEYCRTNNIEEGDPIEIIMDGDNIILHKYQPGCILCGGVENLVSCSGKNLCRRCIDKINNS